MLLRDSAHGHMGSGQEYHGSQEGEQGDGARKRDQLQSLGQSP